MGAHAPRKGRWPPSGGETEATSRSWRRGEVPFSWRSTRRGARPQSLTPRSGIANRHVGPRGFAREPQGHPARRAAERLPHTPRARGGGPQDAVLRASKRRSELPSVHSRCVAPGFVPGGGLFQVNCSRVGTRCLLGTSALLGSVPTPLGDVAPNPVVQHPLGVATDPAAPPRAESVHHGGHRAASALVASRPQPSRPARTASLIRSPSAMPRTSASPAWVSHSPTPEAVPVPYAVSAPR